MTELTIIIAGWIERILVSGTLYLDPEIQARATAIKDGWAASSSSSVKYIAWVLGIVMSALVTFAIINSRKEAAKRRGREYNYFQKKAIEKELEAKEMKLLNEAVKITGFKQPYRILDSLDIFQHMLADYEKKQKFSEQEQAYYRKTVDEIKDKLGFSELEEAIQLQDTREVRVGQPVNIQLTQGEQVVEYSSTVIENTDSMVTLDASELGEDFKIPENAKMEVLFFRESDAGYRFNVIILDPSKLKEGKLVLKHPDDKLVRIQARSFSRMDVYFPFNYHHIPKKNFNTVEIDRNLEDCDSLPVYMADTVDISGGGLAFNTRKKLPKGHYIYLNFQNLSDQQNEPLLAQVVWSGKDKENNANLVRAKYYDITDKMRDEVMRFIYQMQRQFARRLKYAPKKR